MNNNQLFDEHIKEQLGDYDLPVHPRVWENIVVGREKKRPAGFWFNFINKRNLLLLLGLLIAGGSGAWLWIRSSAKTSPATQNSITGNKKSTVTENSLTAGQYQQADNDLAHTTPEVIANTNTPDNNVVGNRPLSSPFNTKMKIGPAGLQTDDDNSYSGTKDKTAKATGNTNIRTTPGSLSTDTWPDDQNNETLPVGGSLLGRLMYTAERVAAHKKNPSGLWLRPIGFMPDCPALEKNASGNKKYIEVYAGPDYAFRSLKDTGNSAYLQKRKESTKFTSAYSAGIRYTKVFNNSMSLRAGVNYSQINEKFTFVQGNLVQVTYIIDANGDTTGSYITTGKRYKTTHNKYRSVDIPVMVGYEVGNGRLHANINVGPVLNVYSWQKGEVLDTAYQPVNITTGKGSSPYQFKTNAGIGFMGAVSVYYKLNDKVHIMAEPYYRHNFSQMNKENLTLKQKYNTVGIRVGVRIDLK